MTNQEFAQDRSARPAEWLKQALIAVSTQTWLASMAIHMAFLVVLALVLGTIRVVQVMSGAVEFQAVEEFETTDIAPFTLVADQSYDPLILNTESLTASEPATDVIESTALAPNVGQTDPGGNGDSGPIAGSIGLASIQLGFGPRTKAASSMGHSGAGSGPTAIARPFASRSDKQRDGATIATERAVAAALNWLARHQNTGGSWSIQHTPRCKSGFCSGPGQAQSDPAATALGLLPFLAAGQTHQSDGPYQKNVRNGVNYLLKNQRADGDLSAGTYQMYAHGLATIALCEAYGMTQDSRIGTAAQSAIRFIESGQNREGSWRYVHGSDDSDTSVFGWQVMALKSGQMAGLKVNPVALHGSKRYLKLCASGPYGSQFSYMPGGRTTSTMTSVGLLTSQYLGARRSDPVVLGGIEYLKEHLPSIDDRNTYYWYYATQAMHNVPGPEWDAWNRKVRRILIDTQERSGCAAGSWDPAKPVDDPWGNQGGRLMVTSLSCLTLEVYHRYLPLYRVEDSD